MNNIKLKPQLRLRYYKKVKCTLVQALMLCTGHTAHRGSRSIARVFHVQRHYKGVRGQRQAPTALYTRERPGTHCTGGWVEPRVGLDRCGKSRPPPGFDPWTFQLVANRYPWNFTSNNPPRMQKPEAASAVDGRCVARNMLSFI